jgi:hypothetical protein
MSVIIFELKDDHIKLLKGLRWGLLNNTFIVSTDEIDEDPAPFGCDSLYEGMDLILNGKDESLDPFKVDTLKAYSEEQIKTWDDLYKSLPMALEIIIHIGKFETGTYKAKYHNRQWVKIK